MTDENFNEALEELLETADDAGVDVVGAWECRDDGGPEEWEVLVSVVRREE